MTDHLFLTVMTNVTAIVFAISGLVVAIQLATDAFEAVSDRLRQRKMRAGQTDGGLARPNESNRKVSR